MTFVPETATLCTCGALWQSGYIALGYIAPGVEATAPGACSRCHGRGWYMSEPKS